MSLNNLRTVAGYLGVLALTLVLFLTRSQDIGWAAPGQSPDQQTVAPRTPTPTLSPLPTPTTPPSPVPTRGPAKDGEGPAAPTPTGSPNDRPAGTQTPGPTLAPRQSGGARDSEKSGPAASPQTGSAPAPGVSTSQTPAALADLSLSKTVTGKNSLQIMEAVTFTIVVTNSGPGPATNVGVKDLLPVELILEAAYPSQGDYRLETGLWQAGTLFPGESISLSLRTRIINMGTVTNTAEILAVDQPDPDSTPGNGITNEDDLASAAVSALPDSSPAVEAKKDNRLISTDSTPDLSPPIAGNHNSFYWLYALIFGLLIALLGLFLINRAQ